MNQEGSFTVETNDDPKVYKNITHVYLRPDAMKTYKKLVVKLPKLTKASEFWPWRG